MSAELPRIPELPAGGVEITQAEADAAWADAWTPDQVAARLTGVATPWYVAGGWALDLFQGRQSRPHADLEIAVPAAGFLEVRGRFPDFAFVAVGSGRIWEDPAPEVLNLTHQTWLRDPARGNFLLDVFREPHDGATWIYRRDPSIRLPYTSVIRCTSDGIPYLAPELALLFKAAHPRAKDQDDFAATAPLLDRTQRRTLSELLARAHPGHPWQAEL